MPAAADHTVIVRKEPDLLDVRRVPTMPVALPGTPSSLMVRIGRVLMLVDQQRLLIDRLLIERRACQCDSLCAPAHAQPPQGSSVAAPARHHPANDRNPRMTHLLGVRVHIGASGNGVGRTATATHCCDAERATALMSPPPIPVSTCETSNEETVDRSEIRCAMRHFWRTKKVWIDQGCAPAP